MGGRGEGKAPNRSQKLEVQWVQMRQNSRPVRPDDWIRNMDLGKGKGVTVR